MQSEAGPSHLVEQRNVHTAGGPDGARAPLAQAASLVDCFTRRAAALGPRVALRFKQDGSWQELSWTQWEVRARHFAGGLIELGLQPGDRVGVLANTRVEWAIADLGCWMAGTVTTPLYATSTAEQVAFIALLDSGLRLLVCEDLAQLSKVTSQRQMLAELRHVVCMQGLSSGGLGPTGSATVEASVEGLRRERWALTWQELLALGAGQQGDSVDSRIAALSPEALASIVYTSGTGGHPKGVRITHQNLMYTSHVSVAPLGIQPQDTQLLFLPLAHIIGRLLLASSFHSGCVTALDANPLNLLQNCHELGVDFLCAVPRILEKLHASFKAEPAERLRAALGGRVRFILSGGASLPRNINEFFDASGVPIDEGYGLTESTGTLTLNLPQHCRAGSVGVVARGTELRIASDGEVLARGPGIMLGYHARPEDDRASLQWVDGKPWLCTGDIGRLDAEGFLWITDWKKDLFKLSTGKYIAPQVLENLVKAGSKLVSQVVVCGEGRAYATALCTLNLEGLAALRAELQLSAGDAELSQHPEVRKRLDSAIQKVNESLAPFERVQKFAVVHPDFAIERGELTPTLKVRRKAIVQRCQSLLDLLYDS